MSTKELTITEDLEMGDQYKLKEGICRNKSLQGSADNQNREITELNHFTEEITLRM